jgi:hypothetical protein
MQLACIAKDVKTAPDTLSLIKAAQGENGQDAMEALMKVLQKEHMPRRIRRFLKKNVLVQQDEIESAFLEGCWKAVRQAKMDIGNPLLFICWKGELAVTHLFRAKIREGVKVDCSTCGVTAISYKKGSGKKKGRSSANVACGKCGATDVKTFMIISDESQSGEEMESPMPEWDHLDTHEVIDETETFFNAATYDIFVDEIRAKLNGRVLQLFDALCVKQINRDTSQNYLQEIADEWGVTTACVSVYLRKLRLKVMEHLDDNREAA